jgi:hypothetical protein
MDTKKLDEVNIFVCGKRLSCAVFKLAVILNLKNLIRGGTSAREGFIENVLSHFIFKITYIRLSKYTVTSKSFKIIALNKFT